MSASPAEALWRLSTAPVAGHGAGRGGCDGVADEGRAFTARHTKDMRMKKSTTTTPAASKQTTQTTMAPHDCFPRPALLDGDDAGAHDYRLEQVKAHVEPRSVVEGMDVDHAVHITWDMRRCRDRREPLIVAGNDDAILEILAPGFGSARARALRNAWLSCDPDARRDVRTDMDRLGLTKTDTNARSAIAKFDTLACIDRQVAHCEHGRRLIRGGRHRGLASRIAGAHEGASCAS